MAVLYMRNASGRNYRNSSFIVDVVMGNIPRSTERMSSFFLFLLLYDWLLMSYKHGFCCQRSMNVSFSDNSILRVQFFVRHTWRQEF